MCQLLLETLEMKFEALPKELIKIINSIKNTETLRILHHHAMKCNTIDDFKENMRTIIKKIMLLMVTRVVKWHISIQH